MSSRCGIGFAPHSKMYELMPLVFERGTKLFFSERERERERGGGGRRRGEERERGGD